MHFMHIAELHLPCLQPADPSALPGTAVVAPDTREVGGGADEPAPEWANPDALALEAVALVAEADQEAENFQYLGPFASDEHNDQKSAKQMAACRALEYLYPDIYAEAERVYEELATA